MALRAFLGDPALKADILNRVEAGLSSGWVVPSIYLKWSDTRNFASLAGAIAKTQAPELFTERTGIPLELALLCETFLTPGIAVSDDEHAPLGFRMHASEEIWAFATEWIAAIPLDADVGDVVARFLPLFLQQITSQDFALSTYSDTAVQRSAAVILAAWQRETAGDALAGSQWRTLRGEAMLAAEACTQSEGLAIAELVEALAWPLSGIESEAPGICQRFLQGYLQALALSRLSDENQALWRKAHEARRQLDRLASDPHLAAAPEDERLAAYPEWNNALAAAQSPDLIERMAIAKDGARLDIAPFLRRQMDILLSLLGQER